MTERVKPRRRYHSPHRREQAAQTRRAIVSAASRLFLAGGFTGTTMSDIAAEAGVVVETLYRSFSGKASLLVAVVEAALAGGVERAELPVEERPAIAAVIAEQDPRRQVELFAATQPGIHRRAGPLLRALRDARGLDPELAKVWDELEAQRHAGQGRFGQLLASRGALRQGLSEKNAADIIWTLCSPAVHDLLVVDRGWSSAQYGDWLAAALVRELLPTNRQVA
ncbi:MAG: TetR/AcrR family transcriptional regulator [Chloroflexota bacterium]|nr:TetR/AcrR family transcriptional regulator [Chloroflexota bacterium]